MLKDAEFEHTHGGLICLCCYSMDVKITWTSLDVQEF